MKKQFSAAQKAIQKACREKTPIYLFGDGDLDGISSVLIAERALERIGGHVSLCFFSDRQERGYGLSNHYLRLLGKQKPGLLLIFDCGTGNRKEVEKIKKQGFEVVIVDHHEPTGPPPRSLALINPKLEEENPFRNLCAASLSAKLARKVLGAKIEEEDEDFFSVLSSFATITDQMERDALNQKIIKKGIETLSRADLPIFDVLLEMVPAGKRITAETVERYITPLLSSAPQNTAYLLFKETSAGKIREVIELLKEKRVLQKERVEEIVREVRNRLDFDSPLIFEGDKEWPLFLAARAASHLVSEFERPVFLYHKGEKTSQGSARAPADFDLLAAMEPCANLLINWGGHRQAAGFGLKNKNLAKFKQRLVKEIEE